MHKNKTIPVTLIISGALSIGIVKTADYISDIKNELQSATEQVEELKGNNLIQEREIDKLTGELEISIKENVELENSNKELIEKVESLEKELEEKVWPTQYVSRTSRMVGTPIEITMTFYGDFAHENGGYAGLDCNGNKLIAGTVASNYYAQGTQFELNGQLFTVRDRGGSNFNSPNRLDVFVPRLENESNSSYSKRIKHYGRKTVTMYKR